MNGVTLLFLKIRNFLHRIVYVSDEKTLKRNAKIKRYVVAYIIITLIFCPYFNQMYFAWYKSNEFAFYYVVIGSFLFNCCFTSKYVHIDAEIEFIKRNFSSFFSLKNLKNTIFLFLISFRKTYLFLKFEKFLRNNFFLTILNFFKNLSKKFILWRPLFKRFSYFGFNKLTKNKFNKFK